MKIAINCIFFQPQGGGIKEYLYNLVSQISKLDKENDYIIYVLKDQYDYIKRSIDLPYKIKKVPYDSTLLGIIKRSLYSQSFWYAEEESECFDIFHSPFFYAPKFRKAKLLITAHDLRLYRYPRTYHFLRYVFLKYAVKNSLKRADRIISISEFTKKEIIELCDIDQNKIVVIHEAINRDFFSPKCLSDYSIPKEYVFLKECRFIFTLGHVEPRKNYERLIEAFNLLKEDTRNSNLKLVIGGKLNLKTKRFLSMVKDNSDILYLNYIPDQLLIWLYKNTSLFVFPSIYEGFGFPPLEAASLGTISAVSNASCIPEVCGDSSIYFDPYSVQDIADKIAIGLYDKDVITTKEKELEKNLNRFSWEINAQQTIDIYKSM